MTLLLTHITPFGITFAADRAITLVQDNRIVGFDGFRSKIFQVPNINGGIGYFGLAKISGIYMDRFIEKFIGNIPKEFSIEEFTELLKKELDSNFKSINGISGIHICGYDDSELAVKFFLLRNYNSMKDIYNQKFQRKYNYKEHIREYVKTKFWFLDLHNGTLEKYNNILKRKFEAFNNRKLQKYSPKYMRSLQDYEKMVKSIFREIIKRYRKENRFSPVNTENGEPEVFTLQPSGKFKEKFSIPYFRWINKTEKTNTNKKFVY